MQRLPGRVEEERGGVQGRRRQVRAASFVAALAEKPIAPFLLPAHRTGRDHFGHPALGRVSCGGMRRGAPPAWPSHKALVGASESSRELPGSRQSPSPQLVRTHPEPGLLPSPGVTRVHRYYEPLRRLSSQPSDEGIASALWRPDRPPVLQVTACVRAAPTTPASRTTFSCRCIRSPSTAFV